MKQVLTFLAILFCLNSYSQGNWTLTGTKNRWGNGMGFSSKSAIQLASFTNVSDSNLVQWSREDSTLAVRGSIYAPWRKLTHSTGNDFIQNQSSLTQTASYKISDTGWAVKVLRSNKGLIDSIQASTSAGGYLVTNGGAAVMHWGGGGSVEVDFKGFAGYDANRSSSYTIRSFTDKGYVDSIRTVIGDSLNTRVRLQTGAAAFQQVGKIRVSDTIRTGGYVLASNLLTVSTTSAQALSGNNTSTGRGLFSQAVSNNAAMLSNTSNDSSAARIVNNGNAEIASFENGFGDVVNINNDGGLQQFNQGSGFWGRTLPTTLSANRTYTLPNASGTIALTSNVTDSAAALRASINTKLNISDTAAMLTNYLRKTDTATMLSRLTFDRVLANGNTTGRTFTAGGATLTGALSGTSGTFSGSLSTNGVTAFVAGVNIGNDATFGSELGYQANANTSSRRWKLASDRIVFGDFAIQQSTTQFGSTYDSKIYINPSGNVGIGTNLPAYKLDVNGTGNFTGALSGTTANFSGVVQSTDQTAFLLYQASNAADTKYWGIQNLVTSGNFRIRALNDALSNGINAIDISRTGISSVSISLGGALSGTSGTFVGGNAGNLILDNTGQQFTQLLFQRNQTANTGFDLLVDGTNSTVSMRTLAVMPIVFSTSAIVGTPVERIRITPEGRTLFNTTTDDGSNIIQAAGGITATGKVFAKGTGTTTGLTLASTLIYEEADQSFNITIPGAFPTIGFKLATTTGAATFSSSVTAKTYSENVVSVSGDYTVASDVGTVYASSNTYTITLPSASGNTGRTITIKRTSTGLGTSITISGVTLGTSEQGGSLPCHAAAVYRSDGTNWYCISYHEGGCN